MGEKVEDEITDLQTRLAFQDQALNEFNDVITDQQQQIDRLQRQIRLLGDKLKTLEETVGSGPHTPQDETPPHY